MSDAPHPADDADAPHEGPIRTPKQVIAAVIASFVIPIAVIVLLVIYVVTDKQPAAGSDGLSPAAVAQRVRPVGKVEVKDMSDPSALQTGEQVYGAVCMACHAQGAANAPKLGDAPTWAPRLKNGYEALLAAALKGKGAMPPQSGGDHSDLEIARAVVYMANKSGAKFEEPKAVVATAAAPKQDETQANAAAAAQAASAVAAATAGVQAKAPAGGAAAASAGAVPALYGEICQTCHASGVAGAPKFGDKAAWAPRLPQGLEALTSNTIKGKGAMPPRGGSGGTDAEIKAVVSYMVNGVK